MGVRTKQRVMKLSAVKIHIGLKQTRYCLCRTSNNKPFCHGTDYDNGFRAHGVETRIL